MISLEVLIRNIPSDFKDKRDYLEAHSNEIETLILGSSHSFHGLNPEFFSSKTYNAAFSSQILFYDLEILRRYESDLTELEWVILPISPPLLYSIPPEKKIFSEYYKYQVEYDISPLNSGITNFICVNSLFHLRDRIKDVKLYYFDGQRRKFASGLGLVF